MKAEKVTRAMKVMKAKRVSKVAKGKRARATVFAGRMEKTASGMTKAGLIKNKRGKIVSKKKAALGKSNYAKGLGRWTAAVVAARKALSVVGFVAINGKTGEGKAIYAKARTIFNESA